MSKFIFSVVSSNPTLTLNSSQASVDEGSQVTIALNTTGFQNGQQLPFQISGTNINVDDFIGLDSLSGVFTIQDNSALQVLTLSEDAVTEGTETFTVTTSMNTSVDVNIVDTSITPAVGVSGNYLRTITSPTPGDAYLFGSNVKLNGNRVAVSEIGADTGAIANTGAVYVMDITTGTQVCKLTNPMLGVNANFGEALDFSGNTVAVFSYLFDATTGALDKTLLPFVQRASVSIAGNYVIRGNKEADPLGVTNAGEAYINDVSTGNLLYTLRAPTLTSSGGFGAAVAATEQYALVLESKYSLSPSVVHVFDIQTGTFLRTLQEPTPSTGYGPMDISGNYAIVGSPYASTNGKAYVYDVTTGSLISTLNDPTPGLVTSLFGSTVSISGQYAIVGAPDYTPSISPDLSYVGIAHVFDIITGTLIATLRQPSVTTGDRGDRFGNSVSISGAYAVVGATHDDITIQQSGSVFVFN